MLYGAEHAGGELLSFDWAETLYIGGKYLFDGVVHSDGAVGWN